MNILVNDKTIAFQEGDTLIETARRAGINIPALCYAKDAVHKSSCMICAVKDCKSGQIIPSCTTKTVAEMQIDTESEEVVLTRTLSLELLLSDHRADCEAPCSLVCPFGLDVERVIHFYDSGQLADAFRLIATAFPLPELKCRDCKAPCEKACRRGTVDQPVAIRSLIEKICQKNVINDDRSDKQSPQPLSHDKTIFYSRLGQFTANEKQALKATITTESRCLHCACEGKKGCKLREYATALGVKRSRYSYSSATPAMSKQKIGDCLCFEPAKCIKCGLCVYNSDNGFAFQKRGFVMQVVLPPQNEANISRHLAELCPCGALY
ncbi:MAG: (2Fe-2S)-binding protein [Candidatus Symbiothrix sp.]|jgi:predicted molibdopterin-dependent oxidoreductase YjgC|nr:(2Fe-2S)-binding protein [Candidatus Symbiothrix sp.]